MNGSSVSLYGVDVNGKIWKRLPSGTAWVLYDNQPPVHFIKLLHATNGDLFGFGPGGVVYKSTNLGLWSLISGMS